MSIDVPTELLTASSGSVGPVVFARNQHGPYTRARTASLDPATAAQLAVRAALSECVTAWRTVLTETERQGWDAFAHAVRVRTALGRHTNAGGLGMYIRANVPRIQAVVGVTPRVDQAPTRLISPSMDPITRVVLNIVDDTLIAFIPPFQGWLNQLNGAILFYTSRPQPLTVNYFRGPYRYAAKLIGQPLGPPYSPWEFPSFFPATTGERVFVRIRQTRADARIGPSTYLQADYVPQVAPTPVVAHFDPGPPWLATVQFTEIIRQDPHSTTNWIVRHQGLDYPVRSVDSGFEASHTLNLRGRPPTPAPPGDFVSFLPPPFDVTGLLTGIDVAQFLGFPFT